MVSKIAFGGIPIMRLTKTDAAHLVRESINMGINFIDTAHGYTDSEEKIGDAIKGIKRENIVIASKSPADDKPAFLEHLDLSLKRLGTDYIDIYQFHGISSESKRNAVFSPNGAMEGMEEAVKAGKIRFPAFSSHNIPIAVELMKTGKFAAVQLPFNYIDDAAADEAIPLAAKLDMGFIAMKPMGGGLLDDAGLSFRYLLSYDSIVPDPGIEKIEEIREIVSIVEKNETFTAEDKVRIENQRKEFGPSWCHRCDYCQPCPQGIQISLALCVKSMFKRMTHDRARSFVGPAIEKARTCLECRECTSRCPYHLDIPSLLKEQITLFDTDFSK
jgi:predicted aldo/keto reductase-like oxidoreductase